MLKKIFGSKKSSENGKVKKSNNGFYMEIEEDGETQDSAPVEQKSEKTSLETPVLTEATTKEAAPSKPKKTTKAAKTQKEEQTSDTPAWVQLLYKNNQDSQETSSEASGTFADKYLLPTPSNSRRRPGGSMSKYMDMASQVKSPQIKR